MLDSFIYIAYAPILIGPADKRVLVGTNILSNITNTTDLQGGSTRTPGESAATTRRSTIVSSIVC